MMQLNMHTIAPTKTVLILVTGLTVSNVIWLFIKPKNLSNVLNAITEANIGQVCNAISKMIVVLVHGPSSKKETEVETGSGIVSVLRLLHQ